MMGYARKPAKRTKKHAKINVYWSDEELAGFDQNIDTEKEPDEDI